MMRILGIGNALVDVMTLIDNDYILEKFSLPKGSMQLVDGEKSTLIKSDTSNFKRNLVSGGSAANTIHGLAMLGIDTGFIGSIGKDDTGDFFEKDMKKGNGFVFEKYSHKDLNLALQRAIEHYNTSDWNSIIENCMKYDSSWKKAGRKYADLYRNLV